MLNGDRLKGREGRSSLCNRFSLCRTQNCTKCLCHTSTTIVCSASPDADNKCTTSSIQGSTYQLSNSIRCRNPWISLFWCQQRQTCTCRHLNDCCFPISQYAIECLDSLIKRPHDRLRNNFSTCGINKC